MKKTVLLILAAVCISLLGGCSQGVITQVPVQTAAPTGPAYFERMALGCRVDRYELGAGFSYGYYPGGAGLRSADGTAQNRGTRWEPYALKDGSLEKIPVRRCRTDYSFGSRDYPIDFEWCVSGGKAVITYLSAGAERDCFTVLDSSDPEHVVLGLIGPPPDGGVNMYPVELNLYTQEISDRFAPFGLSGMDGIVSCTLTPDGSAAVLLRSTGSASELWYCDFASGERHELFSLLDLMLYEGPYFHVLDGSVIVWEPYRVGYDGSRGEEYYLCNVWNISAPELTVQEVYSGPYSVRRTVGGDGDGVVYRLLMGSRYALSAGEGGWWGIDLTTGVRFPVMAAEEREMQASYSLLPSPGGGRALLNSYGGSGQLVIDFEGRAVYELTPPEGSSRPDAYWLDGDRLAFSSRTEDGSIILRVYTLNMPS